jgi:ribosomal protein L25 (general stress protein Ctc)
MLKRSTVNKALQISKDVPVFTLSVDGQRFKVSVKKTKEENIPWEENSLECVIKL